MICPRIRSVVGFCGAVLMALSMAPGAQANPIASPQSFRQTITCEDGNVYQTTGVGEGLWSPAHDLTTNAVLTPVLFGEITFTFVKDDGTVQVDVMPAQSHGPGAVNAKDAVSCDYLSVFGVPGGTVTVTGTLSVVVTPRR
jgi:hypothetical protein